MYKKELPWVRTIGRRVCCQGVTERKRKERRDVDGMSIRRKKMDPRKEVLSMKATRKEVEAREEK